MTNKFFKFFVDIFSSPTSSSNGKRVLMDKLGEMIHADLLCINKSDREEILNQVGISLEAFTQSFQVESFSNLWSIELLIINKLNRADLVARLWSVRKKFHSQVGDDVYQAYVSSLADELTEEKIKALIAKEFNEQASIPVADQKGSVPPADCIKLEEAIRGDIINITRQSQRLSYYKLLRLDSIYKVKGIILFVLFSVLVLMFMAMFILYGYDFSNKHLQSLFWLYRFYLSDNDLKPQDFSLVVLTIFSGMIGSCMSLLQRTEKASGAPSSFTDSALDAMDIKLSMSLWYVLSLVFSGAIFATILYLLAASNIFTLGDLFPKLTFQNDSIACRERIGIRVLFSCVKSDPKNTMMLVWAFMAGFAERLVPDTLDSLMEKAKKAKM